MSNKKKIIIMSSLVLLLAVTAVFNFVFANASQKTSATGGVTTANYFTTYRAERTTTRNEELVQLDSVIALYDEGDEKYEEAMEMKMEIVSAMEQELILENMVKSLGFSDAVVSVSSDSDILYEPNAVDVFDEKRNGRSGRKYYHYACLCRNLKKEFKKRRENIVKTVELFKKICYNRLDRKQGDLFECPILN